LPLPLSPCLSFCLATPCQSMDCFFLIESFHIIDDCFDSPSILASIPLTRAQQAQDQALGGWAGGVHVLVPGAPNPRLCAEADQGRIVW
jgi:hypothetical protein